MPRFVNNNVHPVRVKNATGGLERVRAGQVVEAEGAYADALCATEGVETASSDDEQRYEESVEAHRNVHSGPAHRAEEKLRIGPLRTLVRMAIAAPLRRVVGDDTAPHGPGSGTVTTKAEAAWESPADREAYAQHEALPGEAPEGVEVPEAIGAFAHTSPEIHAAQARNAEVAEDLAQSLVDSEDSSIDLDAFTADDEDDEDDDGEGEGEGEQKAASGEESDGDGQNDSQPPESPDYDSMSLEELRAEAKSRGLPVSGNTAQVRKRLQDAG